MVNPEEPEKVYVGDAVYVQVLRTGMIRLTTEDAVSVTNEIFLEPAVYGALIERVAELKERL